MRALALCLVAGCGFSELQPGPPAPRSVDEAFDAYAGGGQADDVAVLPDGDLVVVGCEHGTVEFDPAATAPPRPGFGSSSRSTFVARLDRATRKAVWTRRSSSPCGLGDDWTVPRVAVSTTGAIWVAAYGWGRGPYDGDTSAEQRAHPVVVVAFDGNGGLGVQRDLAPGLRVRAMAALPGDRIAIAGQSALEVRDRSTAYVAALDSRAADVWRTALPAAHAALVESLAVDGDSVLVGGHVNSTVEVVGGVARGRESDGFVMTLRGTDGAIAATWSRHYAGVNMDDVRVAIVDGKAVVAYGVSQRVGNPWPVCGAARVGDCLPAIPPAAFSAFLVEPVAAKPAWRRVFAGTTHTSVMGIAATRDRVAVVIDAQGGSLDLGRGAWTSKYFSLGAYLELATSTGDTTDARRLLADGEDGRIFFRRVIWDGAAFTAIGEARGNVSALLTTHALVDDAPFVWRIGTTRLAAVDDDEPPAIARR